MLDDAPISLDIAGWSEAAIGAGEPVYKKAYRDTVDAYYAVSLDQIRRLATAQEIKIRTTGADAKEFWPLFQIRKAKKDLAGFVTTVAQ